VFIHAPVYNEYEAFGQVYVEALASGVPSIFTISGVANEFIKDGRNALVAEYANAESIYNKMILLLENPNIRNQVIENGRKDIEQLFGIDLFYTKLKSLYLQS
jgi:glycosyltransferase involved in cell wall biosynthesis